MTPIRGDVIATNARSQKWLHRVAGVLIQLGQRIRGLKGWRSKHVVQFIGKLNPAFVARAAENGQLIPEAKRLGLSVELYADMLLSHDDWCMSMTSPYGRWERLESIQKQPHAVYRQKFIPADKLCAWEKTIEAACWRFIARDYDEWQLGGIPLNWLLRTGRKAYKRIIDGSRHTTVCSGAVAGALRWSIKSMSLGIEILGGTHSEMVVPAHYKRYHRDFWRVFATDPRL